MVRDDKDAARNGLLEGFFRRREEAEKFYCAACLIEQLRQRGSQAFSLTSVHAAVVDAFERSGTLRIKPAGPCDACELPWPCIGAGSQGPSATTS
jgi:hypothetical protein